MTSSVVVHLAQRKDEHRLPCGQQRRLTYSRCGAARRLRGRSFLESVLSNPKVKLRACQPKSPCRSRFVATAIAQDLGNRGAFDDAQIGRILAESAGARLQGQIVGADESAFTQNS